MVSINMGSTDMTISDDLFEIAANFERRKCNRNITQTILALCLIRLMSTDYLNNSPEATLARIMLRDWMRFLNSAYQYHRWIDLQKTCMACAVADIHNVDFSVDEMRELVVEIPESIKESLDAYVNERRPTGDFLYAVLTNNLRESFGRADDENRSVLFEICAFIYNELPADCWGSPEKVKAWLGK